MPEPTRDQVFISYSHKDTNWRKNLETHLKPYLRDGSISGWSDEQIVAGSKWFGEIKTALTNTKVAVLLVTPDFLSSDFIYEHELGPLLKEAEQGGVKILWVPVRASSYQRTALQDYQAILSPNTPLAAMTKPKRDDAWVKICEGIEKAVNPSKKPSPVDSSKDTAPQSARPIGQKPEHLAEQAHKPFSSITIETSGENRRDAFENPDPERRSNLERILPMNEHLPSVFIGSSTEGVPIADAIEGHLEGAAKCVGWSKGAFGLNHYFLESLVSAVPSFDFAIFVLTLDDLAVVREKEFQIPRDNVLFELGLFIGGLGRERCFMVYNRQSNIHLPFNLAGVTSVPFQLHVSGDLADSLRLPINRIQQRLRQIGLRHRLDVDAKLYEQLKTLGLRETITQIVSHISGVKQIRDVIFDTAAKSRLDEAIGHLSYISRGTIPIDSNDDLVTVPAELSRRMRSLRATTLWSAGDPASATRRKLFLALQRDAIKERQATVQRLFIIQHGDLENTVLLDRMQSDHADGVSVRWVLDSEWMATRDVPVPVDVGIWDEELVWLYVAVPHEVNRKWSAEVIRDRGRVAMYGRVFAANWEIATTHPRL